MPLESQSILLHLIANEDNLKYLPGKARSHHLEMMMSKDELEEEQRSVESTSVADAFSPPASTVSVKPKS